MGASAKRTAVRTSESSWLSPYSRDEAAAPPPVQAIRPAPSAVDNVALLPHWLHDIPSPGDPKPVPVRSKASSTSTPGSTGSGSGSGSGSGVSPSAAAKCAWIRSADNALP